MGCAIHARPVLGRVTSALYTNRYHILRSGASSLRQECLGALRTSSFTPTCPPWPCYVSSIQWRSFTLTVSGCGGGSVSSMGTTSRAG